MWLGGPYDEVPTTPIVQGRAHPGAVEFGGKEGKDPTVGSSLKHGEEAIVQCFSKKRGTITIFMTNNISFNLNDDISV